MWPIAAMSSVRIQLIVFFLHSSRRAWCAVTLRENHLKRLVSFDFERERESELATQELHFSMLGLQDCRGNRKTTLP